MWTVEILRKLGLFPWADIWTFKDESLLQIFLSNPPDSESFYNFPYKTLVHLIADVFPSLMHCL